MKILNTMGQVYTPRAKETLETLGAVDCLNLTQAELEEKISAYDILLVGLGLNINQAVINKAINLKIIATATTGLDHIDLAEARAKKIEVLSLRGETDFLNNITGTAELAFGLLLDLARYISVSFNAVKGHEWQREKYRGHNLSGQTLGIVGLGRLGRWTARYGNAFNMNVIAYDPLIADSDFVKAQADKVDFETLIKNSDFISVHVHLSPETENMFNSKVFDKMKSGAYLINTARGKIVNENDLLIALKNKTIAGYGADVLANELNFTKTFAQDALVEYAQENNNCVIVPHTGGMTYESRAATDIFIANKIINYLKNDKL